MKVKELVKVFKENGEVLENIEISKYVPIEQKRKYIDEALIPGLINYSGGIATYDSIEKKVVFLMTIVQCYTDLEIEDVYTDYDLLVESQIIIVILDYIKSDYAEFYDLFEARFTDALREYNSLEAVVNRNMEAIANPILETVIEARQLLNTVNTDDIEKLIKLLDIIPGK